MRTFAQKPKTTQQITSAKSTKTGRSHFGQRREESSILHLQRTIGNQAVLRLLEGNAQNAKIGSTTSERVGVLYAPETNSEMVIKNVDLAVKPKKPNAIAKELTEVDIQEAIIFNKKRFKSINELIILRDVLGLSSEPASIDEEFVKTVAQWQAENELKEDGKIGPKTAAVIGYEMLQESKLDAGLKPDAIRMLERGISISLPGNSYTDSAAKSEKNITFSAFVPKGLNRDKYAFVNWVKGYMKKGDGTFFQAKMYGINGNANWADYQVDSVDTDPIYWSTAGSRRNYNNVGSRRFTATDSPGPALNTEHGAEYKLNFKLQIYRVSDLPAATAGNLGGKESKAIATVYWGYEVKVSAGGGFTH